MMRRLVSIVAAITVREIQGTITVIIQMSLLIAQCFVVMGIPLVVQVIVRHAMMVLVVDVMRLALGLYLAMDHVIIQMIYLIVL